MHAVLSSHMLRVQASRGQQCTSAARSCSLQAVAADCSRSRKHPNADPLANARLASPGGLSWASLHGQLVLVEQLCSRSSSLSATLFRAAAKAFAQLCTSCLPACLLHAAEIGPDARCMWRPTQLLCACPDLPPPPTRPGFFAMRMTHVHELSSRKCHAPLRMLPRVHRAHWSYMGAETSIR